MKICLTCSRKYNASTWHCPTCGSCPEFLSGYPAFAPDKAVTNEGFKATYFEDLAKLEADNFWFKSRNKLIVWALNRHFPHAKSLLEIGCGTGYVLSGVRENRPDLKLSGSEIHSAGLFFAQARVSGADFFQMDAKKIPFYEEFDVIGSFDVLEHIDEDEVVLGQMHQAVTKSGGIIVTVPQHKFLWSYLDEYACHVRRYNVQELKRKIERAGFMVIKTTSFVTLLLPLMAISRYRKRRPDKLDALSELYLPGYMNYLFEKCLDAERSLLKTGFSLPMGGSLMIIAKKQP